MASIGQARVRENQGRMMSDAGMVAVILLALVALGAGGVALFLFVQTVTGLGFGGLAFTGAPIFSLGAVAALSAYGAIRVFRGGRQGG